MKFKKKLNDCFQNIDQQTIEIEFVVQKFNSKVTHLGLTTFKAKVINNKKRKL